MKEFVLDYLKYIGGSIVFWFCPVWVYRLEYFKDFQRRSFPWQYRSHECISCCSESVSLVQLHIFSSTVINMMYVNDCGRQRYPHKVGSFTWTMALGKINFNAMLQRRMPEVVIQPDICVSVVQVMRLDHISSFIMALRGICGVCYLVSLGECVRFRILFWISCKFGLWSLGGRRRRGCYGRMQY